MAGTRRGRILTIDFAIVNKHFVIASSALATDRSTPITEDRLSITGYMDQSLLITMLTNPIRFWVLSTKIDPSRLNTIIIIRRICVNSGNVTFQQVLEDSFALLFWNISHVGHEIGNKAFKIELAKRISGTGHLEMKLLFNVKSLSRILINQFFCQKLESILIIESFST